MAATEFGGNEGFTSMKFGVGGNKKGSIDLLGARRTAKGLQVRGGQVREEQDVREGSTATECCTKWAPDVGYTSIAVDFDGLVMHG